MTSSLAADPEKELRQGQKPAAGLARLFGLQSKLIIPYAILTLILASTGIYVITRLVTSTIRERFVNQMYEAARVASDAIVRQERSNLENLRLVIYTEGVAEAIGGLEAGALEDTILPLAANNGIDALTILSQNGIEILTLGEEPTTNQYVRTQGTDFSSVPLVQRSLSGVSDEKGDKYVGILETNFGPALFTGAPVYDSNQRVIGSVLVGTRLDTMLNTIQEQALADIVILSPDRQIVATTLIEPDEGYGELQRGMDAIAEEELTQIHDLEIYNRAFQITYTQLKARGENLGWLGVILPSEFVVAAEATSRNLFSAAFALGTIAIILIGYALSQTIARPILRLRSHTQAVAAGDLDQNIGLKRSDEIGELAEAFDIMTLRLRERTAEAARLYNEAIQRNEELAEINARLQATQLQLIQSEKLAAIGQLTAGIVHDVKNPLTVIKGVSELMLSEDDLSGEFKKELTMIHDSAVKANNIVSDLLKFARQSELEMGEHDMRDTIQASLRLTTYLIRQAHVQVIRDLPEQPVIMTYDFQQIEQVMVNLVTNAIQAMTDGGELRVTMRQSEGAVAIAIQDTGTGIPPENLSRIFDPFFTTKPEGEGTGLGLSVSYGIITKHSGRIEVESEVGEGTTFTILLPVKQ